LRAVVMPRPMPVIIAGSLLLLGLYPGPTFIVLRSAAWRTDIVVQRFADERAFWIVGLLVIVGPAVVLANLIPRRFDRAWDALRRPLRTLHDGWFIAGMAGFAMFGAAAAAVYVLSRKPTTSDEVAQLWHARILLSGRL